MKKLLALFVSVLALSACTFTISTDDPIDNDVSEVKTDVNNELAVKPKTVNKLETIPQGCLEVAGNKDIISKPFFVQTEEGINKGVGVGQATLFGTVSSRNEELLGQTVERVYFVLQDPAFESTGLKFFNYYKGLIAYGNTVNLGSKDETGVGFAIGTLENGKLSTTAGVSEGAMTSIMNALNQGTQISLTLSVPNYVGRGAPANFTFACMIEQ